MQDARDSRQKGETKTLPHPPKNHGENTGKTRQGEPTNPEERNARRQGEGKTRQGETHPPRENREAPLDAERKNQKTRQNRLGEHLVPLIQLEEARAHLAAPTMGRAVVEKQKHKITKTQLTNPVVGQSS